MNNRLINEAVSFSCSGVIRCDKSQSILNMKIEWFYEVLGNENLMKQVYVSAQVL